MKRDMELIRKIAFLVEGSKSIDSEEIVIESTDHEAIAYHVELMVESGLLSAVDITDIESEWSQFRIERLTSKGHDFVDSARSETVWNKTVEAIKKTVGGTTLDLLMQYLKAEAGRALGLPSGVGP
jgi:hypothetical protein